jgi:hypothetical protein
MRPSQGNSNSLLQKIQGTELFDLLEKFHRRCFSKIAKLGNFTFFRDGSGSFFAQNDLEDFDVGGVFFVNLFEKKRK